MSEQSKTPRTNAQPIWFRGQKSGPNNTYVDIEFARQLETELADARAALGHVMWIKDCGVDGRDEAGVFRNHPDVERDAMYKIAKDFLAKQG